MSIRRFNKSDGYLTRFIDEKLAVQNIYTHMNLQRKGGASSKGQVWSIVMS